MNVPRLGLVLLLAVGSGCGATDSAQAVLSETEQNLGDVRSGRLSLELLASSSEVDEGGVGFELNGKFAVASEVGELPVADLMYTRLTGAHRTTNRFRSTGSAAYVEEAGQWRKLDESDVASLRADAPDDGAAQGLEGLRLDAWIDEPRLRAGPSVGGTDTDLITAGSVDPVAVLNDWIGFAAGFESDPDALPAPLAGEASERLRRVVTKSEATLLTGKTDRLLRRATVVLHLQADADEELSDALGPLAGVRLEMKIEVDDINQPVSVDSPTPDN